MRNNKIRELLIIGAFAGIALVGYLLFSLIIFRLGFPLDDAWIHQVYARNLIQTGEWAFIPGVPSAGSTAPVWSWLLSVGYLFNFGPLYWSYGLGWAVLWAIGAAGYSGFRRMCPTGGKSAILVGVLLVIEWHLVWAAGSGMETLLFALLALIVLLYLIHFDYRIDASRTKIFLMIGAVIGIS